MPTFSKLTPPKVSGIVQRRRLFRFLETARQRPVTWISGPAGSGKTILVASFLQARTRKGSLLWYQVDAGDADAATLFHHLSQAAERLAPRKESLPVLTPESWIELDLFARRYFRELYGRMRCPATIVFDDYHEAPPHSRFHEVIRVAVDEVPEGVRLILMSREQPPPQLARAIAGGAVEHCPAKNLPLTFEETRQIMRLRHRRRPAEDMVRQLHERTAGWAAGLTLMLEGLGADDVADSPGPISEATFDYFAREVLQQLSDGVSTLLLKTAFLREMTAAEAACLVEVPNAERVLSVLVRRNHFIEKRGRADPVYRYHPLFREFLLRRARETFAEHDLLLVQRRAAAVQVESGRYEDAAMLLTEIGDWDQLARVVSSEGQRLYDQGRIQTLQEWLSRLPAERIESSGWLQYWLGMCALPFGAAASRAALERAFALFEAEGDGTGTFQSVASIVATYLFAGDSLAPLDRWIERLLQEIEELPPEAIDPRTVSTVFGALMYRQPGHPEIGVWAERALAVVQGAADVNRRLFTASMLTFYHCWMGDRAKARLVADEVGEAAEVQGASPLAVLSWKLAEASYHWHAADADACRRTVESALDTTDSSGVHLLDGAILTQAAAGALTAGALDEATAYLRRAAPCIEPARLMMVSQHRLFCGWRAMMGGDLPLAHEHVEVSLRLALDSGAPVAAAHTYLAAAQVLHEHGDRERAADCLSRAGELASLTGSALFRFAFHLIEAHWAFEAGDDSAARLSLRAALQIGRRCRLVNTPWWHPPMMTRLCVAALESGIEVEYVRELICKRGLMPEPPPDHVERWPWDVRVFALGGFEIEVDGQPVRLRGKVQQRPLALMQALIALGGRGVPEPRLADALWPDADGDAAHRSFTITLHRLRRLLTHESAIALDGGRLSLDRRRCWVDASAFESLLQRADLAGARGEARTCIEKAVRLYRGPFLAGEAAPWALSLRERLHRRFLRAIERLGEYAEEDEDWPEAIQWYERGLEIDDLVEELYRRQMLCYRRLGRRAEALTVYERCRRTFRTVLGVEPFPQTESLHRALRRS